VPWAGRAIFAGRAFGTRGECWSRRAYRLRRRKGPASASLPTSQAARRGDRVVLNAANLTQSVHNRSPTLNFELLVRSSVTGLKKTSGLKLYSKRWCHLSKFPARHGVLEPKGIGCLRSCDGGARRQPLRFVSQEDWLGHNPVPKTLHRVSFDVSSRNGLFGSTSITGKAIVSQAEGWTR
jgi:hypothetical protein